MKKGVSKQVKNLKFNEKNLNLLKGELEKFSQIFEMSPDMIGLTRLKDSVFVKVNKMFLKTLGFKKEEVIGKPSYKLNLYTDLNIRKKIFKLLKKGGKFEKIPLKLNTNKGKILDILFYGKIIKIGNEKYILSIAQDISKEKQVEKENIEIQTKLNQIITHSSNLFYIHNTKQVLSYVSPQSEQILGYKPKEAEGKWTKVVTSHPMNKRGYQFTIKALKTGKKQEPYYLELKRKDGKKIIGLINESPIKNKNGKVIGITGSLTDVTKEYLLQQKLNENQILLKNIFESIISGILVIGTKEEVLFYNSQFKEMWNIPEKLLESKNDKILLKFVLSQLKNPIKFLKEVKRLYKTKEKSLDYLEFKDSRVLERMTMPFIVNGKLKGRIWVFRDLTQIRQFDKIINYEKVKFDKVFDNLPVLAYNVSLNGKILNCNKKVVEVLGYKNKQELIGKPLSIIYAPESLPKIKKLFIKWKKEGKLINEEMKIKTKKGITIDVLLNIETIRDKNNKLLFSIFTQQDVSAIVKMRDNLGEKLEELETFKRLSVGRELKMIELKKKIKELEAKDPQPNKT
ncbi:MAG: PAS domain S-box protein [Nanoarchaeota archaeon]|nr:PAS domain S-box protein [Nanoarchaeota archaeon]